MTSSNQHRALITGASSGIGRATALIFAEAGIELALVSRSQPKLESVAAEVRSLGGKAKVYPLDLSQVDQVRSKMAAIVQDFSQDGSIDILVNNAGMGLTGDLQSTSLEVWQQVINLNLTSVLQCIQAVVPGMRDRQSGTIINIASIAAHQAFPEWGAYSVSKAGLVSLSKVLAAEERAHGIRVVTISPGAVNTPIWESDTMPSFDRSRMLTPETIAQSILHVALLPPQATIEELTLTPSAGAL
ncbi:MAG: SDR family oxidoreductase [Oculatellaceae cyanobacterium Prado106]|nr:SDR family oxidoreductase [Oculatellaceae cyanobacterium Prado106]